MAPAAPSAGARRAALARRGSAPQRVFGGAFAVLAVVACAALLPSCGAKETVLSLTHVDAADPLAVCNDGSPGAPRPRRAAQRSAGRERTARRQRAAAAAAPALRARATVEKAPCARVRHPRGSVFLFRLCGVPHAPSP